MSSAPSDLLDEVLKRDDGGLGAAIVSTMSWEPTQASFAALGRIARAAPRHELMAIFIRGRGGPSSEISGQLALPGARR